MNRVLHFLFMGVLVAVKEAKMGMSREDRKTVRRKEVGFDTSETIGRMRDEW